MIFSSAARLFINNQLSKFNMYDKGEIPRVRYPLKTNILKIMDGV